VLARAESHRLLASAIIAFNREVYFTLTHRDEAVDRLRIGNDIVGKLKSLLVYPWALILIRDGGFSLLLAWREPRVDQRKSYSGISCVHTSFSNLVSCRRSHRELPCPVHQH